MDHVQVSRPDVFSEVRTAWFQIPVGLPLNAAQCAALETELEDLLRRSTDIPPLFFVGHNHAGAFRISVTSRGDGTFDLRELAALNWLCCDLLKNGYRGRFNTIDALHRMKSWGKIAESYDNAEGTIEDLLEAIAELPSLTREALYDPDPANLQHQMLAMFEAAIGRTPTGQERIEFEGSITDARAARITGQSETACETGSFKVNASIPL